MAKKKYDISDLEGLKKVFDDAVEDMAHEILWKIENFYETAIDRFYADYNPLYYNRTYNTYLGSSGYENLFSSNNIYNSGDVWTAGITIDPSYIPGKPYRADKDWVFNRTFVKGIHGINAAKIWGNTYVKRFQKITQGKKTFEAIWINGSGNMTKRKRYYEGNLKFKYAEMSNMIPSPKAMVSAEFRKLTKKKNMKKIFNEILKEKLNF